MAWHKEAISDGEIDALARAALAACTEDTRFPRWRGASAHGGGECYNMSHWLVGRLGGAVGARRGHYVWLSPDERHYIDLTGHHAGHWLYQPNDRYERVAAPATERATRFAKRADRLFEGLPTLIRLGLDYAGDAYPAEAPQAADDSDRFNDSWIAPEQYWHDEPDPSTPEGEYQWVYANGQLEVSPDHSHSELSSHLGIDPAQHTGPFACGHLIVATGRATWQAQANVNLHSLFRVLKDATKNYGWTWGGMTDASGQPIIEDFAPKKEASLYNYVFGDGHLLVGRSSPADLVLRGGRDLESTTAVGRIQIQGSRAVVSDVHVDALPSLFEFAADQGLTLYAGNDNVIKTIPDLQQHDIYDPDPAQPDNPVETQPPDERLPSGLYSCPNCQLLFPSWREYGKHRAQGCDVDTDHPDANGDGGLPEPDPGLYGDGAHFTEMRQEPGITTGKVATYGLTYEEVAVLPARTWKEAARVDGFMKYATAFDYDNDGYNFYVAYRDGDPLGYAVVQDDGGIQMVHAAVESQGVGKALHEALTKHYDSLYTNAAHEKSAAMLKRYGWLQTGPVRWRWSKDQAPTDMLDAPVPFIYDVQEDKLTIGHPGARTSDIPGRFTPGGIVEGTYEPGGKVVVRSLTSIPYTVRHLIKLWYYTHPQLEVKSVHLQDDAGKDTRLASLPDWEYALTMRVCVAADPAVHRASRALVRAGGTVYAVGGAVRDVLMDREPADIDLMVTGIPGADVKRILTALPGKVVEEGKSFAVFHYRHQGREVHIALPRTEISTGPGHSDFAVTASYRLRPEEDLYRRDFTVNAMAINLAYDSAELLDPFGGRQDIASGTLRTLGPHSLREDPLRVLRGLAAVSRFALEPDAETRQQMRHSAAALADIPAERVRQELDKLLGGQRPAYGVRLAHETGALAYILPEVDSTFGYDQNNPHHELELGEHLLATLERIASRTDDRDLRLAALLHDIGKPASAWADPDTGHNHFYAKHQDGTTLGADHEQVGADLAEARLRALRFPNARINRITELIRHHMWGAYTTERGARRFLARVGSHSDDLLTLRWADQGGKSEYPTSPHISLDVQQRLLERARDAVTTPAELAVSGHDLMAAGIERGPRLGQVIAHLTEQVIDDPALNTRDSLLLIASAFDNL